MCTYGALLCYHQHRMICCDKTNQPGDHFAALEQAKAKRMAVAWWQQTLSGEGVIGCLL